jgi:antitoxin HigA-1
MLAREFMAPLGTSANALARTMEVPPDRVTSLIKGEHGMTGDTALRLERVLGVAAEFWMHLQATHDLTKAKAARSYDELLPIK